MLFRYILAFNYNSVIKLYSNGFFFCGILIDTMISTNQRSYKLFLVLFAHSTSPFGRWYNDCYEPCFHLLKW